MWDFILGALLLIGISVICAVVVMLVLRTNSERGCVYFVYAFLGSLVGHWLFGAWGPGVGTIYLLPALLGAIAGLLVLPVLWLGVRFWLIS